MTRAQLITIPFSHYCEKARWALDRCGVAFDEQGHLPLVHWLPARRAGGGRTVPVLVAEGGVVADSTDIVRWADARRPGTLLPAEPALRAEVDRIEDDLDERFGPHARRWAYHQVLGDRSLVMAMGARGVPGWERRALPAIRPLAALALRRLLRIDDAGVERSRQRIDETFAAIGDRLADGRRYLVGDRFTAADLTFAALAAPVVLPDRHPFPMPPVDRFPAATRDQIARWREHPAGAFARRIYLDHRPPV